MIVPTADPKANCAALISKIEIEYMALRIGIPGIDIKTRKPSNPYDFMNRSDHAMSFIQRHFILNN
jgi:hypothetical protein